MSVADGALWRPLRAVWIGISAAIARPAATWLVIGAAAAIVMLPRLSSPSFGLLDDGLIPLMSSQPLPETAWRFDQHLGRFRPLYWLALVAQYRLWGPHPLGFFLALTAALAVTAALIAESVALASRDRLAGLLAGLAFVLAPPAIENYYTVSKGEPGVVLALALSVFLLVRAIDLAGRGSPGAGRHLASSCGCLLVAFFWKETTVAMVMASGLWLAGSWWRDRRLSSPQNRLLLAYFAASLACAAALWGARSLSGTFAVAAGTYSVHYALVLDTLWKGALRHLAFTVRDFPLLLIGGAVWVARQIGGVDAGPRARWLALGAAAWIVSWTAVMLPWRATIEYYLLPFAAGAAALTGVVVAGLLRDGARGALGPISWSALAAGAVLAVVTVLNGATNGRVQIAVDAANADLLDYVAAEAPRRGAVLVNLPAGSEYIVEMREHLARLRGRPDLRVGPLHRAAAFDDALVLDPIMREQPAPSVRLGFAEGDRLRRAEEIERWRADRSAPLYDRVREVRLASIALETPLCPLLLANGVLDGVYCGSPRPVIDRRTFQYGWRVYVVAPPTPRARLTLEEARVPAGGRLRAGAAASIPVSEKQADLLLGLIAPGARSARFVTESCELSRAESMDASGAFPRARRALPGAVVREPVVCAPGVALGDLPPGSYTVFLALVRESTPASDLARLGGILAVDLREIEVLPAS